MEKWKWKDHPDAYKNFIIKALEESLEIINGDWDREDYWEVYVMARQNVMLALELMRDLEITEDGRSSGT